MSGVPKAVEDSIAPGLLIAMPQLLDPNFARSVVLMIRHEREGSFGLVLNRPGVIPVRAVLEGFGLTWQGSKDATVGFGGPVMSSTGWLVHEPLAGAPPDAGTVPVADGIELSMSETLLRYVAEHPPRHLRFVMGYAGWGEAQLARELVAGAWLHAPATSALVFETPVEEMWERALRSIGVNPAAVVRVEGVN